MRLRALFVVVAFTLTSVAARAGDDVKVGVVSGPGGRNSEIVVKVNKDLATATFDVKSSAGKVKKTLGPAKAGGELRCPLPHDRPGKVQWSGALTVAFDDGTGGSMPLSFATTVLSGFKFRIDEEKYLRDQKLFVTSEHDTDKIDVEVYGEDGDLLANQSVPQNGAKAGTAMLVEWIPSKASQVFRIHVTVHDTAGAFQGSDLFPYNISIPHEDVEFDTGKHDIRPTEEPKLVAALAEIEKALKRYGTAVKVDGVTIKLWVHGHTDTVGSSGANQGLSERRANSIAKWFAKRGVKVAIYARGFGEGLQKVDTPDETENQSNRRCDYDVGVNGPTGSTSGWARAN